MKNIILIGMKGCGKSTVGKLLAEKLRVNFIDSDREIEKVHAKKKKEISSVREIFKKYGTEYFDLLESESLSSIAKSLNTASVVFSCGGKTPLYVKNQILLKKMGKIIFLNANKEIILPRVIKDGIPPFFPYPNDPKKSIKTLLDVRLPVYRKLADYIVKISSETPEEIVNKILKLNL